MAISLYGSRINHGLGREVHLHLAVDVLVAALAVDVAIGSIVEVGLVELVFAIAAKSQ